MAKPRVLHLITSLQRGGRERQAAIMQSRTRDTMDARLAIFAAYDDDYRAEYALQEDELYILGKGKAQALKSLKQAIREFKPDVVWCWGKKETAFAMLLRPFFKYQIIVNFIQAARFMFSAFEKHAWITIANHSRYIVGNSLAGMRLYRLKHGYLLRNGYEYHHPAQEDVEALKAQLDLPEGVPTLVSVSNLLPVKDYPTVLRALARLHDKGHDFRYMMLGEGPRRAEFEALIEELGLTDKALLMGRVSNVPRYLALSDIFIHSSYSEGTSNAIIEALMEGLPVVASATGGTPEIVQNQWGRLFKCEDDATLAQQLEELIGDAALRRTLGEAGQRYAEHEFALDTMLERYANIVDDAMRKRRTHEITIKEQ